MKNGKKRLFTILLGAWLLISTASVSVFVWNDPVSRAVISMGWGLILFWIFLLGSVMFTFRDTIKRVTFPIRIDWKKKFVIMCTILALIEEAITTTMTNLAPWFGVEVGEAYITASANYLDVVAVHSVVVFVPMFIGWAWLLSRYDFSPFSVFLLFGITGTIAETTFGIQHLLEFGLWIFVYGLMVYIPAYCIPENRETKRPHMRHYLVAIFLPFIFVIPVGAFLSILFPDHPAIHF